MKFPLIAFDLDGTLADTEALTLPDMVAFLSEEYGINLTLEHFLNTYHGMSGQSLIDKLNAEYGTALEFKTFLPLRNARLPKVFENGIPAAPGVLQVLRTLATQGRQLCVCSNSDSSRIALSLELITGQHSAGLILANLFEGHIFSAVAANSNAKPAPDVYLRAATYYKANPTACLAVEDSLTGVKAAVAAGYTCIAYTGLLEGHHAHTETAKMQAAGAQHILTHWDDFPQLLTQLETA